MNRPLELRVLKFERIHEKDNKHHDKGIDGKGLDHRETDDERCRDFSGYAGIPCNTFACLAQTDTLTNACPEGSKAYGKATTQCRKGIVIYLSG